MEIVVEPNRLQRILNTGLIGGSLESVLGSFKQDGLYIEDKQLQTVGVKAWYPVRYFATYKIEGEGENISLTADMVQPLGWHESFKKEKVKLFTKDNKVFYQTIDQAGKVDEHWDYELTQLAETPFNFPIPDSDKGFLPTGKPEKVQILLPVSQLMVHKAERYKFICDNEKIELEVREPGCYRRKLKPTKQSKLSELIVAVPGEQLEKIVDLYTGEVWLTLYDKGVVFSQKTKESSLTYLMTPFTEA